MSTDRIEHNASAESAMEPRDYCALLVGPRRLKRCDDPERGVCGVVEAETGVRFVVNERALRVWLDGRATRIAV